MAFKLIVLCAALAVANAGYLSGNLHPAPISYAAAPALTYAAPALSYAAPSAAITSQSSNILRSPGNLAQISTYSKTIDTPFSSVSKSDVRVSNPGIYSTTSYAAAPAYAYAAAAPAPVVSHLSYSAPISYAKTAYAAPAYATYAAQPAPQYIAKTAAYAAPAAYAYGAPAVAAPGPVVAHATFSGLGASYAW